MNVGPICKRHIQGGYGVQGQAPCSRGVSIAAVSRMAAQTHTWTGAVRKGSFRVVVIVDTQCQISKSDAATDFGNIVCIKADVLKVLEIDDHAAVLAARGVRRIGVTSTLCLDFDVGFGRTHDRIRNMLRRRGQHNHSRSVGQT